MTSLLNPKSNRSSVCDGTREMIRCGVEGMETVLPVWSVKTGMKEFAANYTKVLKWITNANKMKY